MVRQLPHEPYRRILVPVDFSEGSRHAIDLARQIAPQASLVLMRMSTPSGADPWMLIVQEEQETDCDLVVIGRQGRNAVDEFFLGSTTRMVIAEGAADVLIGSRKPG